MIIRSLETVVLQFLHHACNIRNLAAVENIHNFLGVTYLNQKIEEDRVERCADKSPKGLTVRLPTNVPKPSPIKRSYWSSMVMWPSLLRFPLASAWHVTLRILASHWLAWVTCLSVRAVQIRYTCNTLVSCRIAGLKQPFEKMMIKLFLNKYKERNITNAFLSHSLVLEF